MKKLILLLSLLLILRTSFTQVPICGTNFSGAIPNTSANSTTTWVNVYYHIIRTSNGTGGFPSNQLCSITTELNSIFNQYGLFFYSLGYDFINNDSYYKLTSGGSIFTANVQPNAINIYLINEEPSNSAGGCVQNIPSKAFWILNSQATMATSAHEMGHCLGLYHTHRGTPYGATPENIGSCQEDVNGSNCSSCGDLICDTPSDPDLHITPNSNCQYDGTNIPNGSMYNPDTRNVMSYAYNSCRTRFSPMQVYAMKNTLNGSLSSVKNSLAVTTISGNNIVCSSATFNISNIRSGFYLSNWSSSNTSVATINANGVVSKVNDGSTTITANFTNGCENYSVSKTISVGAGTIGGSFSYGWYTYPIMGSSGISVSNTSNTINFNLTNQLDPATTYSWITNSQNGAVSKNFAGKTANITLNSGSSINLTAQANNTCGLASVTFNCYNYSNYSMTVFPNPANQTISIKASQIETSSKVTTPNSDEKLLTTLDINNAPITMMDKNGKIICSGKLVNEILIFSLDKIPNGTYYLHIGDGKNLIEKQIIIQH